MQKNQDVRKAIRAAGLKQWQVAEVYGINEGNFSRRLRKELPQEEKQKILAVIDEIKHEMKGV